MYRKYQRWPAAIEKWSEEREANKMWVVLFCFEPGFRDEKRSLPKAAIWIEVNSCIWFPLTNFTIGDGSVSCPFHDTIMTHSTPCELDTQRDSTLVDGWLFLSRFWCLVIFALRRRREFDSFDIFFRDLWTLTSCSCVSLSLLLEHLSGCPPWRCLFLTMSWTEIHSESWIVVGWGKEGGERREKDAPGTESSEERSEWCCCCCCCCCCRVLRALSEWVKAGKHEGRTGRIASEFKRGAEASQGYSDARVKGAVGSTLGRLKEFAGKIKGAVGVIGSVVFVESALHSFLCLFLAFDPCFFLPYLFSP